MAQLELDDERDPDMEPALDTAAVMAQELAKDGETIPDKSEAFTGEVTQPEAAAPSPQKAMTIRDTQRTSFMDPNRYIQMKAMANDFIRSGAIPECWQSAEAVLVGFQTGMEMGMSPMESMNSLYFVKGAINVWGKATTKRLKVHGWRIKYTDENQETCTSTVWRGKNPVKPAATDEQYTETFTFQEAVDSGYTTQYNKLKRVTELKVGWRPGMNRRKKLRYGVLALIINTHIPEVLGSAMGIVEVSDDYDLKTNDQPAQLAPGADRKAMMAAAEAKHKKLTNGKFKPAAVKEK